MANLWFIQVVFIFLSHSQLGYSTRFLPMIIWDHLNPILSCKCNWLTIPSIDEYDRVDFMCPSLKVAAKLLDGYSRPISEMNENIFRRKWEGTDLNELKNSLHDGSFCDLSSNKTANLYSCKNGVEGKSLGVTFKESNGYKTGDIFVFFNNEDDGKSASLTSTEKQCSMVLVVNVTWGAKVNHDMSYGKCLGPDGGWCNNINATCKSKCQQGLPSSTLTSSSILSTPSSTFPSELCSSYFSEISSRSGITESRHSIAATPMPTSTPTSTLTPTPSSITVSVSGNGNNNTNPNTMGRIQPCGFDWKTFIYGILLGMGIVIGIIGTLICCYMLKNSKRGQGWKTRYPKKKSPADAQPSPENPEAPDKPEGFSNDNFTMTSPSAPPEHLFPEYDREPANLGRQAQQAPFPIGTVTHSSRLPSIETCAPVVPLNENGAHDKPSWRKGSGVLPALKFPPRNSIDKSKPGYVMAGTAGSDSSNGDSANTLDTVDSGVNDMRTSSLSSGENSLDKKSRNTEHKKKRKTKTTRG